MSSNSNDSVAAAAAPVSAMPQSRSLPNLLMGLLLSKQSSMTTDQLPPPPGQTYNQPILPPDADHDHLIKDVTTIGSLPPAVGGLSLENDSAIWSLNSALGTDSTATPMRRNDSWAAILLRKSGIASPGASDDASCSEKSNFKTLGQSLKIRVDGRDEWNDQPTVDVDSTTKSEWKIGPKQFRPLKMTLSLPVSQVKIDDLSSKELELVSPISPKQKTMLSRQFSLDTALQNKSPAMANQNVQSVATTLDENSNVTEKSLTLPKTNDENKQISTATDNKTTSPTGKGEMMQCVREVTSLEEMTSQDTEKKSRKVGILSVFGSREKKSVRQKDLNMFAPQSW